MTLAPAHALRLGACLTLLLLAGVASRPARAQQAADMPSVPAYQDHFIADGTLKPDISPGDAVSSDTSGLARALRVDAVTSIVDQSGPGAAPRVNENGTIADAHWDTMSYGAWSANGALRVGGSDLRINGTTSGGEGSFSIHQRGMPFDGGWQADNALGDLNAPLINLARQESRFLLYSGPMLGVDTEWRGPSGVQFVASAGEPGIFDGIKVPTFETIGGSTASLGAQWSPTAQWSLGGEYAGAHDVAPFLYLQPVNGQPLPPVVTERVSTHTGFLSAAWQVPDTRAQLSLVDGTLDGASNSFGTWADLLHSRGGLTQSVGAFHIDPNLAWGNQLLASDMQGGYYRVDYQSRRWITGFDIEQVNSVSGQGPDTTFANANARYQLSRDNGIGGVLNILYTKSQTAWSAEGYIDSVNAYGTGRVQINYATESDSSDATLTLQETWNLRDSLHFSTSAAVDRVSSTTFATLPQDSTILRLAAYGNGDLSARLSLSGSVQWATAVQGRAAPSTSADVTLAWQMTRSWSLLGTYYENRIGSWTPLVVSSPIAPPVFTPIASQSTRGFFLTLRYQDARGAQFVPLGGAPGSGSGRLTGVVYLDANENGHYDAGEVGAPNVTVILDGRFSVRTDTNGRFDFPAVVAGHHVLTVQTDNLPLPWTLNNQGRTEVEVGTRDRVDVNIGAMRLK